MIPSGLDIAVDLANQGMLVLYVCEHRVEIPDVLKAGSKMPGVESVRKVNGDQEIRMASGGRVVIRAPHASIRGYRFDAVFAPPLVWNEPDRKADLIASTSGSKMLDLCNAAPLFSTLQRIGG